MELLCLGCGLNLTKSAVLKKCKDICSLRRAEADEAGEDSKDFILVPRKYEWHACIVHALDFIQSQAVKLRFRQFERAAIWSLRSVVLQALLRKYAKGNQAVGPRPYRQPPAAAIQEAQTRAIFESFGTMK
eukprot:scaffold23766_cov51-Prasinocladus_malaysianus.AAC.1